MPSRISRRKFMVGCSAAIAALAGSRLTRIAFAAPGAQTAANDNALIVVFLRGGWDALNVFPVLDGPDRAAYETARPTLKIAASGGNAALPLNDTLGMHPALNPLYGLYQEGRLAVVQACGLNHDTRSHFDAMEYIELGTPGNKTTTAGWMTRALLTDPHLPNGVLMPALAAGGQPSALLAHTNTISMNTPSDFSIWSNGSYQADQRVVLRQMYSGDDWLRRAGAQTLHAVETVERAGVSEYVPEHGAQYPDDYFSLNLKTLAQMMKLDLGLRVGTVDLGGWDTHDYQGDRHEGYFSDLLGQLARGLESFYTDLGEYAARTTVVVMSEFGRRLAQNGSYGTDHGHGSAMLVLGGGVNGGQVYGQWPGLSNDQLYDRADLAVTTDYRNVLSELLVKRLGNPNIETIFPGYTGYAEMGIVNINT
jgi:uncharacterized protein (DUF1501 family)